MNLKSWAQKMKKQLMTLYFAAQHPELPFYVKFLALFIVGYALSPIDLIPDFIPVLGLLDDLILLPALIYLCYKLIPSHVLEDAAKQEGTIDIRHQYIIALFIIVLWVIFIYFAGTAVFNHFRFK